MKKSVLKFLAASVISTSVIIVSCSKDKSENNPTAGLTKITEGYAIGAATKVEVYSSKTSLLTGYNKLYIALYDSVSGKPVDDAHIHLTPMMDMGTMQHSAPYENPASTTAEKHLFPCAVTFVMSSMGGTWTLDMEVHNHVADKEGSLTLPLTVSDPVKATMKSFIAAHDGAKYFVALIEPSAPKTGINDMEIAIYKKASMMSWPADSSLSVTLTPEMPTMGHGSPNNVDPVHSRNGHYKGKVNFTMTGLWRLNLDFMSGAAVADTTQYIDIEF